MQDSGSSVSSKSAGYYNNLGHPCRLSLCFAHQTNGYQTNSKANVLCYTCHMGGVRWAVCSSRLFSCREFVRRQLLDSCMRRSVSSRIQVLPGYLFSCFFRDQLCPATCYNGNVLLFGQQEDSRTHLCHKKASRRAEHGDVVCHPAFHVRRGTVISTRRRPEQSNRR